MSFWRKKIKTGATANLGAAPQKVSKDFDFNFVGSLWPFGLFSGLASLLSILALVFYGLNFGIDFAGGHEIHVKFPRAVSETEIRQALAPLELGDLRVQRFGNVEDNEQLILMREHTLISEEVKAALKADFVSLAGGPDKLTQWAFAKSGESLLVGLATNVAEAQIQEILKKHALKVKKLVLGERLDKPEYTIHFFSLADQIEDVLRTALKISPETGIIGRLDFVGPQVGEQLRNQGVMAVVYSLFFILLYVALRFDMFFAPGAVISILHDILLTLGFFAFFRLEINLPVIAALLTLVGYSMNDTIVVYDRIRENALKFRSLKIRELINISINQTLSRTSLTSLTVLLVLVSLLFFGGGIIFEFAIALFFGVVVGTYSSIAVATPVYIFLKERYDKGATR